MCAHNSPEVISNRDHGAARDRHRSWLSTAQYSQRAVNAAGMRRLYVFTSMQRTQHRNTVLLCALTVQPLDCLTQQDNPSGVTEPRPRGGREVVYSRCLYRGGDRSTQCYHYQMA